MELKEFHFETRQNETVLIHYGKLAGIIVPHDGQSGPVGMYRATLSPPVGTTQAAVARLHIDTPSHTTAMIWLIGAYFVCLSSIGDALRGMITLDAPRDMNIKVAR
jgi:hypothetical protein